MAAILLDVKQTDHRNFRHQFCDFCDYVVTDHWYIRLNLSGLDGDCSARIDDGARDCCDDAGAGLVNAGSKARTLRD